MPRSRLHEVIVIDSSDEEEGGHELDEEEEFERQIMMAMERSLEDSAKDGKKATKQSNEGSSEAGPSTGTKRARENDSESAMSRAEMEAARRLRAEQAMAAGAKTVKVGPEAKRPKVGTINHSTPSAPTASTSGSSSSNIHGLGSTSSSTSRSSTRYWTGQIKRVANSYVPDSDSLTFNDVLGPKDQLRRAIIASFVWDKEWLFTMLPAHTEVLLIMPKNPKEKEEGLAQLSTSIHPSTFRVNPIIPPPKYGCMHVKGIYLFYKDFCRLVIPTANNIEYDWAAIDNALFIHDFRPLPSPSDAPFLNPTHTQFSKELLDYLQVLQTPNRFLAPFKAFDFSSSSGIQFVWSSHGARYKFSRMKEIGGICSLAQAVKRLNFSEGGTWEVEITGSSLGDYQTQPDWIAQMIAACRGIEPEEYFSLTTKRPKSLVSGRPFDLPIKIIFPTLAEVDGSFGGRKGGGTIFCKSKNWADPRFPRHLFYRGQSKRRGVLAHTKHILALHNPNATSPPNAKYEGYIYVGSHNFTAAAWGRLGQRTDSDSPSLFISNFESGVLIPFSASSEKELERMASELVTYQRPLTPYTPTDEPWQQDKYMDPYE